jgi:catecholate siderophore receptor
MRLKKPRPLKGKRGNWQKWLTTGTLVACAASTGVKSALAQQTANPQAPQPSANTLSLVTFDIPGSTLGEALPKFQVATQLHIETEKSGLLEIPTRAVVGQFTPEIALKLLLSGSGLTYTFGPNGTVVIDVAAVATSVEVADSINALSASSAKYSGPLLDTPQSITAIPKEVLEEQGNTTLRDALRNVSGISIAAGEGGAQGDNLTIRGFSARNDLFIDGMRDFGSYYRDPFNTEEVEVFQGPTSVTFGRGSTGGVVNQATKTPGMSRFFSAEALFGTDNTKRGTADLNVPLSQTTAFRLNVMGDQANIAGRDIAENQRYGVAPSLALGLGTPTRAYFSYMHQTADDTPDYGIPWLFNGPAPVNRRNYYGFSDGSSFLRTTADIGTARVEHDFAKRWTIHNQVRYATYGRDTRITEAKINGTPTLATPLSQMTVTRNQIAVASTESMAANQTDITGSFRTGIFEHSVVTGAEFTRETSDPVRQTWSNVPQTSLLNPNPSDPFAGSAVVSSQVRTTAAGAAAYALDTVRFAQKWELTGGVRWDRFGANYSQVIGTPVAFHRVDKMTSWRAALVYKPITAGSIYFAAGTSFNPSAESLALSASTANLPPESNRNYEAGTKWDLNHNRLSLRGAIFSTEKLNAREADPNNSALNVLAGEQRARGITVEGNGRITDRWNMLLGYTHLDAKLVSSNFYPQFVGSRLANVPANTFNFWTTYRLPQRWQIGAGGNFVASRTASATAPLDPTTGLVKAVPGYWVFNAMVEHRLTEHVELQGNVFNIANRYYYDQLHPAHLVPGPGRSATLGLKFRF